MIIPEILCFQIFPYLFSLGMGYNLLSLYGAGVHSGYLRLGVRFSTREIFGDYLAALGDPEGGGRQGDAKSSARAARLLFFILHLR